MRTKDARPVLRGLGGGNTSRLLGALRQKRDHYHTTGKGLSENELSARLTALKGEPDTAWLKEMDSQLLQQVLADLKKAFTSFFEKRARFPRFKSRKRDTARFRIPQRVTLADGCLYVPNIGRVKIRQSQVVERTTKSATFKRDACGHWFVSLVAEREMPAVALTAPAKARTVGVDLGLKDAVVTSDGERVADPRFYRAAQRKLRRAQRGQSRKVKGSNNRARARRRVARVHQKIAAKRNDFCHKLTTRLVKNHDAVCIEDLNVQGLARTKVRRVGGGKECDNSHRDYRNVSCTPSLSLPEMACKPRKRRGSVACWEKANKKKPPIFPIVSARCAWLKLDCLNPNPQWPLSRRRRMVVDASNRGLCGHSLVARLSDVLGTPPVQVVQGANREPTHIVSPTVANAGSPTQGTKDILQYLNGDGVSILLNAESVMDFAGRRKRHRQGYKGKRNLARNPLYQGERETATLRTPEVKAGLC